MRFFFKVFAANLLATLVTVCVLAMVMFAGGALFIVALSSGEAAPPLQRGSVLVLDLNMSITDAPQHAAADEVFLGSAGRRLSLLEVVQSLDSAAKEPKITGLFIHGSLESADYGSSYAALREVRAAIERFKATGKPVVAYLESPQLKDYYLATAAKEIVLNPFGFIGVNGLASESIFLGDALKKYGVGVQVTRVGRYKSATEIFTGNKMSEDDRTQLTQLLTDLWNELVADLATSRGIETAKMREVSAQPGLYLPADALRLKLVDRLAYLDEVIAELNKIGVHDYAENTFRQISVGDYARRLELEQRKKLQSAWGPEDRIAVVYAEGDIVDGEGGPGFVGGARFARHLRELREDPSVRAVVLRVNSPGGSATASEVIQREVKLLRDSGKPVIASFGALAASGGYWIAAPADVIVAEPCTITGSIGVFGLKFNFQKIAGDYGVAFDGVKTEPFADLETITRPWTGAELALAQQFVDFIYDEFLKKVSEGRKLDPAKVREIAQGRVWSGFEAKRIGLVDQFGGIEDAIALAAERAELKPGEWLLMQVPEKRLPVEALLESLASGGRDRPVSHGPDALALLGASADGTDPVASSLRHWQAEWRRLRAFNDPRGAYARLPFNLEL